MKRFVIAIEETIMNEVEIYAENADSALNIAEEKYYRGDIIRNPGEYQCNFRQMAITKPETEVTEWIEF